MGTKEKKDKIQEGVEKYLEIRTLYDKTDFDVNSDFAKKFDAFYRVRRNEEWRKKFFQLFVAMKHISYKLQEFEFLRLKNFHQRIGRQQSLN